MKTRNPFVLPMILHTKHQVFHDKRDERGGSKNEQREYLEDTHHECDIVISGTFIACGEGGNFCSDECFAKSKE